MAADAGLFVRCCHSATREGLAAALMLGWYRLERTACDQPRSLTTVKRLCRAVNISGVTRNTSGHLLTGSSTILVVRYRSKQTIAAVPNSREVQLESRVRSQR